MFKFADDPSVAGLISDNDATSYRSEFLYLVVWCDANNLELKVSKTQELIVDFHRSCWDHLPLVISNNEIQQVDSYKFLGATSSSTLKHQYYPQESASEAFLFKTPENVVYPGMVWCSFIERQWTVWFGNMSAEDRRQLDKVVCTASRIIGCDLPPLS